jgi:hypothetical protein
VQNPATPVAVGERPLIGTATTEDVAAYMADAVADMS